MSAALETTVGWEDLMELRDCLNTLVELKETKFLRIEMHGNVPPDANGDVTLENISSNPNRKIQQFKIKYVK